MRILHVITTLSVGGAETMLRNVALGLTGSCTQHVISLSTRDPIGSQLDAGGVPVTALGGRGGLLMPRHLRQAREVLNQFKPDLVQTWMYHSNVVGRWLLGRARVQRPAWAASVRGALNSPKTQKLTLRLVRALDARWSAGADAILFNSRVSADQHAATGYSRAKSLVIPNGFDVERFSPNAVLRARMRQELSLGDEVTAGLVARYEPVKGHDNLLRAAAILKNDGHPLTIVLAGRGCEPGNAPLQARIAQLGLTPNVRLLGERSDVPAVLNAVDMIVCPSISESFPNAVGEGMACGLPAVVTDVGDCAYLVGDGGKVAPPGDPAALASALKAIRLLPLSERAALGARARERICKEFSMQAAVSKYGDLYRRLLEARHVTPDSRPSSKAH